MRVRHTAAFTRRASPVDDGPVHHCATFLRLGAAHVLAPHAPIGPCLILCMGQCRGKVSAPFSSSCGQPSCSRCVTLLCVTSSRRRLSLKRDQQPSTIAGDPATPCSMPGPFLHATMPPRELLPYLNVKSC
jgi:hypothetical protein